MSFNVPIFRMQISLNLTESFLEKIYQAKDIYKVRKLVWTKLKFYLFAQQEFDNS